MKIDEAIITAQQLKDECNYFIEDTGFDGYGFDKIDSENLNADERFIKGQLLWATEKLAGFMATIAYISKPIIAEGTLRKNQRGRYEIPEREYTSGCTIEYLAYDDFDERDEWRLSSVEHNGNDYYIVGDSDLSLDGLRVRVR